MDVLSALTRKYPRVPVVMITGETDVATVVAAMQAGAYDYITKPVDRTKLFTTLRNAVAKARADLRLTQLEREARNSAILVSLGTLRRCVSYIARWIGSVPATFAC